MVVENRLMTFGSKYPTIHPSVYVDPSSVVIGDVRIGENSSIWPMSVLRGDINFIEIGMCSNVQDGVVAHLSDNFPVKIGNYVTIGHSAVIHACEIGDECLIGMNATIMDGAVIGEQSIIAAGTVLTGGTIIPPGSLVRGVPGKVVKELSIENRDSLKNWAEKYVAVSRQYIMGGIQRYRG